MYVFCSIYPTICGDLPCTSWSWLVFTLNRLTGMVGPLFAWLEKGKKEKGSMKEGWKGWQWTPLGKPVFLFRSFFFPFFFSTYLRYILQILLHALSLPKLRARISGSTNERGQGTYRMYPVHVCVSTVHFFFVPCLILWERRGILA